VAKNLSNEGGATTIRVLRLLRRTIDV